MHFQRWECQEVQIGTADEVKVRRKGWRIKLGDEDYEETNWQSL
jgi:hypothetical protein